MNEMFDKNQEIAVRHQKLRDDNRFFNVFIYPLSFEKMSGAVLRLDDISELEKREAELRQSQKMELVGNLAGGLAHDFNNVLGIIIGNLSLFDTKLKIEKKVELDELKIFIGKLQSAGKRASALVSQLLSLARKKEIAYNSIPVKDFLNRVVSLSETSIDKSIKIEKDFPEEDISLYADEGQIEQVVLNLIVNASHALTIMQNNNFTKNGFIRISADCINTDFIFRKQHFEAGKNRYICISVEDNGIGMDSNTVSKIFEPFFTTKSVGVGTGLGLAMVYNIVKNHNGFIDVYSEPGLGTKFSIYLPVIEKNGSEQYEKQGAVLQGKGTVLVIDDDPEMREIASKMLNFMKFQVIMAENGEAGLQVYRKSLDHIDFILLDVVMPVKSGDQTMKELKEINPEVKVIVCSGFKKDSRVDNILQNGALGFIQKPYTIEELSDAIKEYIMTK